MRVNQNPPCPYCEQRMGVKNGRNRTSNHQRYACRNCGNTWTLHGWGRGSPLIATPMTPEEYYGKRKKDLIMGSIERLTGIEFKWGGRSIDGLDCYGLAMLARNLILPTSEPLPGFDYIYGLVSDNALLGADFITSNFRNNDRATAIAEADIFPGCIVLVHGDYGASIGTVLFDTTLMLSFSPTGFSEIISIQPEYTIGYWSVT